MDQRAAGTSAARAVGEWVLLTYRLPREPSTPRITVWRRLRQLGVAQLGDGLVALPADARTREQLEWLAERVVELGGGAGIWTARPASPEHERDLAGGMARDRALEYREVIGAAAGAGSASPVERRRALRRLRARWRAIDRRDFFPPPEREAARQALADLAVAVSSSVAPDAVTTQASP